MPKPLPLSTAEQAVYRLIGKGFSTREIADKLDKSPKTVDAQKGAIKLKLGLANFRELMMAAMRDHG